MKGYKIAFHEEQIGGTDVFTGLHYETTVMKIPVLVVLDIPDDAKTSTPENRYTEENMSKMQAEWSLYSHPFAEAALRDCEAYFAYKDEDPFTIYNKFIYEYSAGLSDYIHSVKCRCDRAKVVDIVGIFNGMCYVHARALYRADFIYNLHETVRCDDFITYKHMTVCAPGIHYFEYPVLAMSYMMEEMDLIAPVRDGKIDSGVAERYLTEELNVLKKEDKAIEYCIADAGITEKLFEEFRKDEDHDGRN